MTINDRWVEVSGRPTGFDYMRVSLATAVVLWHSYQVAYGTQAALDFWRSSPVGYGLRLIIPMFFALSGFLVAGSMYRTQNLRVFLSLRAIRILPALIVEVVLAALVLGPLLTEFSLHEYFTSRKFYAYFANVIGWIHYELPGVFLHNPEPRLVNSQLWTVPFELECYLLISIFALLGYFKYRSRAIPFFVTITFLVASYNFLKHVQAAPDGGISGRLQVLCFCGGLLIYTFRDRIPLRLDMAVAAIVIASVLCVMPGPAPFLMPVFVAYPTVYLGLLNPKSTRIISSGDYSYGVYLYSCPIQQAIQQVLGYELSWWQNFLISMPIITCFALFSWWCVEQPFLKLRRVLVPPAKQSARPVPGTQ